MKLITSIFLLIFLASCSSWSGQTILSKATVVTGQQLDSIRMLFKQITLTCSFSIEILKTNDTSGYDLVSTIDTNNNILKIALLGQDKTTLTEIAVSNSVGNFTYAGELGDTILCEQTPNFSFIAWFNEPFYKNKITGDLNENHRYELHIKAIEISSGNKIADEILYTKDCCLDRLDMIFNPYTQSVLYAFNDFGEREYKILYGQISVKNNKINFKKPYGVTFKDETEKRQPTFVDNGKSIYLYHTTGDDWGIFSGHTGKQQIGIFQIDSVNKLVNNRMIYDSSELNEKIVFIGDTIFYRLKDTNEYDKMTIKKIAWQDLKKD